MSPMFECSPNTTHQDLKQKNLSQEKLVKVKSLQAQEFLGMNLYIHVQHVNELVHIWMGVA